MYIYFLSFGCKVNLYETEFLKQSFEAAGYDIAQNEDDADAYVINSCTVTSSGDKKVRQTLSRLRRKHPHAVIALTGCFPQAFPEQAAALDADIIAGTKDRCRLHELFSRYITEHRKQFSVSAYSDDDGFEPMKMNGYERKTRAFVKIQDGCNRFCSYCIIPYARGRIRSKPLEALRAETNELAAKGYKEIVLTGINLCFYGESEGYNIADAVEVCCAVDGIERVRLGSLEPEKITDEVIARLSSQHKLCPQFHLSLQSGCDSTLMAMNRHYTSEEYADIVRRLRAAFPECAMTTDVMTGFPGETDEDFIKSLEFVKSIGFARVHVFPYSEREGTRAASMDGAVPMAVRHQRAGIMSRAAEQSARAYMENMVGKVYEVLFERENEPNFHRGYTANYTLVRIYRENDKKSLRNSIKCVRIKDVENDGCTGEILVSP